LTSALTAALLQALRASEESLRKPSSLLELLGLLTLSACGDPVSAPDSVASPTQILAAGGQSGAGTASMPPPAAGGSGGSGGTAGSAGSAGGRPPAIAGAGTSSAPSAGAANSPPTPPMAAMPPDFTPEQFCGLIRVDEGGALVIAGCELNIRSIYSLEREQLDGGAWHSTSYGIEAPCNSQGTYRAEVSDIRYGTNGLVESYLFLIRSQAGYDVGGSLAIAYEATRLARATGLVQGNSCQFSVCGAAECGILDTTQLSTVRGDAGAGGGGSGGSASVGGAGGRSSSGGAGGRSSGGRSSGGRSSGGSNGLPSTP
jgi:hypothetical protein